MGGEMVRVYIITEVRSYREALAGSLHTGPLEVVGTAAHPLPAIPEIRAVRPDVALLDLPGPGGPGWARELFVSSPRTQMLVFGVGGTEHEVAAWAEAGAVGYVGRDASIEDVAEAIHSAARGEAPCHPRTAAIVLRRIPRGPFDPGPAWQCGRHLTTREREVVNLLAEDLTNKQIARQLCIAVPTVKNHVHHILEKLAVGRRSDAVREVRRVGFMARGPDATFDRPPAGGSVLPFAPRTHPEVPILDGHPGHGSRMREETLA